ERPNRFTLICNIKGTLQKAYLPNPGRLWELLLPGARVFLENKSRGFTVWATEKKGHIIMLHTHYTNKLAEALIRDGAIPSLKGCRIKDKEVTLGHSRIDLLISNKDKTYPLEVKSCTLFGKKIAMFPDAVSKRATRHLYTLSEHNGMVLFVVQSPEPEAFLPEFHIDPEFSSTLYTLRTSVRPLAISIRWDEKLRFQFVDELYIPWHIYEQESHDRGIYMLVLEFPEPINLLIGSLGSLHFQRGYYIYAGSGKKALSKRIVRHLRRPKKTHWHIDHLTEVARKITPIPIRTSTLTECDLAETLGTIFERVHGFGSSDCQCQGHLFYSPENPFRRPAFVDTIIDFRINTLERFL
ncbi:MAG: DUF123 domain-containing protein, partial [Nitrospirae bacterium]